MKMRQYIIGTLFVMVMLPGLNACGAAGKTKLQRPDSSGYIDAGGYTNTDSCTDSGGNTDDSSYMDYSRYTDDTGGWNHAWYVYWDADVKDELLFLTEKRELSDVSMFACYFSEDGQLYMPQGFGELREIAEELAFPLTYLSFTNDVQHTDGSATQKDPEFVRKLWANAEKTEETADAMLAMTKSMGAAGIEIDFENIKEPELWADYVHFLELLWVKAQTEEISMRVVLSISAPVEDLNFPIGPEYSVMCYNLYGTHSGPGPKADIDFLIKAAEKFSKLRHVTYALATGGFEWNDGGTVTRSLTQEAAEALAGEFACKPRRDRSSHALYYTYRDNGKNFTVWYADEQTLAAWRGAILDVSPGAEFDLWRVGGNRWH